MGFLENFSTGYSVAISPANLLFCFLGVFFGTLVGVLPGIGPAGAIAMLLPTTFGMNPVSAIIMLAGIYYGAQYGGSTTSILVNIPGEASSVITCLDGYQMARQGRAGPALGIAAFGSFFAGTICILPMMILAELLSTFAIRFGPPEYFAVIVLGLALLINLAQGSAFKGFIMALLGIALSQIGMDMITGANRLTFGIMGFYGLSLHSIFGPKGLPEHVREILHNAFKKAMNDPSFIEAAKTSDIEVNYMNGKDYEKAWKAEYGEMGKILEAMGLRVK